MILTKLFPKFVEDAHFRVVQYRNWLIGGWLGFPFYKFAGPYEWDNFSGTHYLGRFPYVDIFISHAPVYKLTDKKDYAHIGGEGILRYIKEKQPKYVCHDMFIPKEAQWWVKPQL